MFFSRGYFNLRGRSERERERKRKRERKGDRESERERAGDSSFGEISPKITAEKFFKKLWKTRSQLFSCAPYSAANRLFSQRG